MTAQNQRDPDGTDILGQVRDGLADLKANVISRWGRVPHVASDPATLNDGMEWVRSDTGELRYRANGATVALDSRYVVGTTTAWTAVTFQGAWVNFGAGFQTCQYRKVGDNVQIRGVISTGVAATTAFTLPAGFRPPLPFDQVIVATGVIAKVSIDAAGAVVPSSNANPFINVWFSTT